MDLLKLRRTVFELLLDGHVQLIALIHYPGVKLPEHLTKMEPMKLADAPSPPAQPVVTLDYGYALARPPADFAVDDTGITATLIFNGVDTPTFIPWGAVIAIRTPDDAFVAGFQVDEPPVAAPEPPKRGGLRAV